MENPTIEILAPAGDWDMLRAAVYSGADCVYVGVEGFNARRPATNFGKDDLARAVAFCHARNCKVYAAFNTLVLPGQREQAAKAVQQVVTAGCDAIIVQDLGVAAIAKQVAPQLALHASTQMSVHSLAGVQQLAKWGFSRAILARELQEDEIAAIAVQSPIELEVFVHGALCVSVSGQCMMSAFLGGRSANRGACAGTCRLPFGAKTQAVTIENSQAKQRREENNNHLSMKDLSILDALPRLQKMGIASAKIEGRLRGPEYCAVVVDSARKAALGHNYDRQLLHDIFSRSGFTDGWFTAKPDKEMFGTRTAADLAAGKKALPKARALYRRERARVPITIAISIAQQGGRFILSDGIHQIEKEIHGSLEKAARDMVPVLRQAASKTGGTPFYIKNPETDITIQTDGSFVAGPMLSELRRNALEELLNRREALPKNEKNSAALPQLANERKHETKEPTLRARFESYNQMPENAAELCDELVLPLWQAEQVPDCLRAKTWLWLPRVLFGQEEERARAAIEKVKSAGFRGVEIQNIGHWQLCQGVPVTAGFGLNITNADSVAVAVAEGCETITLSPELSLRQMGKIARTVPLKARVAAFAYGHIPVMLTRACPLKNVTNCEKCKKQGYLVDRKGLSFPVLCQGKVRSIYNPVVLWMGDRLLELPADVAVLYFTVEDKKQAAQIIKCYKNNEKAPFNFTRGLYDKGLSDNVGKE